MKKDEIRRYTGIIIRKNGEYLVGTILNTSDLRWSNSPYEAYRTRDREKAAEIARKTGGVMMLFNPIVNQLRIL